MSKSYIEFTVVGKGKFPLDMLSFDKAVPLDTASCNSIENSFKKPHRTRTVQLWTEKRFGPTKARWESFGWRIIQSESFSTDDTFVEEVMGL